MKIINKKPPILLSFLEKIQPLNLEEEKQKFFFDPSYNPQFEYPEKIPAESLLRHGEIDNQYFKQAVKILDTVVKDYGSELEFQEKENGPLLTAEDSLTIIEDFLKHNRLENLVRLTFSSQFSARTSLKVTSAGFDLQIRTPIKYRKNSLQGMLYHEIGTHLFRWINEMEQPWHQNHNKFGLKHKYLITEEGLAAINNLVSREKPFLWSQALNYFLVYEGSQSTFAELNKKLKKYVENPDRRWNYCLKVKRGVEDTSTKLVFSKNQIYFIGVVQVLRWLVQNDYKVNELYLGKLALKDLSAASKIATKTPVLPDFLHDREKYIQHINKIIEINKLAELV